MTGGAGCDPARNKTSLWRSEADRSPHVRSALHLSAALDVAGAALAGAGDAVTGCAATGGGDYPPRT